MIHSFDTNIAKVVGIRGAIIYRQLKLMIENAGEQKDGYIWVKASVASIADICPYLSKQIIDRELKKLMSKGFIECKNLNENKLDRALSYRICK